MKKQRTDGQETRTALLQAAGQVFARKGFWEATNADICEMAETNSASINYHFGSKENLYVEAWKFAFQQSLVKYPDDGGVPADAPVQERFYGKVKAMMRRIADPENYEFDIIHKEMANPTGLLHEHIHGAIDKLETRFKAIIRELLGPEVSERQVILTHMAIKGQCFGPMLHLRRIQSGKERLPANSVPENFSIEELAHHIVRFSLFGIHGLRNPSITLL